MKLPTLGAVTAALAVCAVAGAQTKPYLPIGVNLRLGGLVFSNQTSDGDTGSGAFAFGADYALTARTPRLLGYDSHLSLSVDYYRHGDTGNIPVLLNYVATSGRYYAELGAGIGFESQPGHDETGFAYEGGIGYNVPSSSSLPIFLQANFFGADRFHLNGFAFFVGVKF